MDGCSVWPVDQYPREGFWLTRHRRPFQRLNATMPALEYGIEAKKSTDRKGVSGGTSGNTARYFWGGTRRLPIFAIVDQFHQQLFN